LCFVDFSLCLILSFDYRSSHFQRLAVELPDRMPVSLADAALPKPHVTPVKADTAIRMGVEYSQRCGEKELKVNFHLG
jgi:hypothetical protein